VVVGVSQSGGVCIGEEFAEIQVYSDIAVLVRAGLVRVVRYTSVELEKENGEWIRVRVANFRGEVADYCVKRFTVHPFSAPVSPLTVSRAVRE
jgi:hypothetical protein